MRSLEPGDFFSAQYASGQCSIDTDNFVRLPGIEQ